MTPGRSPAPHPRRWRRVTVDEPELYADPFVASFGPMTFEGNGAPIRAVTIELTENPPSYTCVVFPTGRAPVELRWPSAD